MASDLEYTWSKKSLREHEETPDLLHEGRPTIHI